MSQLRKTKSKIDMKYLERKAIDYRMLYVGEIS